MESRVHHQGDRTSPQDGRAGGAPAPTLAGGALVIAAAVLAALVVWVLAQLLGVETVVGRGGAISTVGPIDVVVATVVAGLAAWAVYSLMSRNLRTARWWPFTASTALAVSVIGPSWLADGASAVALICMHLVVGAVLIAGLPRAGSAADRPVPS